MYKGNKVWVMRTKRSHNKAMVDLNPDNDPFDGNDEKWVKYSDLTPIERTTND